MAGSVISSPATAFVGLSDRQADEISEFIKCKTYLLKADLGSFEADPDCGKGPVAYDLQSLGVHSGPSSRPDREECYTPSFGLLSEGNNGNGGYCPTTYDE